MQLANSNYISDWEQATSGSGTIVEDATGLTATVTAGSGEIAYIRQRITCTAGDYVKFKFLARKISGTPTATIDYPSVGSAVSSVEIESEDWREYEIQYAVPFTEKRSDQNVVNIVLGVITNDAGSAEIGNPRIFVEEGSGGSLRTWACGLIRLDRSGSVITPSVNDNYPTINITNVSMSGKTLIVQTRPMYNLAGARIRPIIQATLTSEQIPHVHVKAGQWDSDTGQFSVKFGDTSTTQFTDLATALPDGTGIFVFVEVKVL